jgi:surface antigen
MTHPTPDWTPETLLAYADGQLSDERARAVERVLEIDPAAARCLADLRAGRDAADGAFARVNQVPPPPALTHAADALAAGLSDRARRRADRRSGLRGLAALLDRLALPALRPVGAMAAVLLVVAVTAFGIGRWTAPMPGTADGTLRLAGSGAAELPLAATDALWQALETAAPGESLAWQGVGGGASGTVTVFAAVDTGLDTTCRPFHHAWTRDAAAQSLAGLACRDAAGGWSFLTLPAAPTAPTDSAEPTR